MPTSLSLSIRVINSLRCTSGVRSFFEGQSMFSTEAIQAARTSRLGLWACVCSVCSRIMAMSSIRVCFLIVCDLGLLYKVDVNFE